MNITGIISKIEVANKTLVLFYDKSQFYFSVSDNDEKTAECIKTNTDEVFKYTIKNEEDIYYLNIASSEDYGNFDWHGEWAKNLLNKQLSTFMPIIQKFIADAITDTL